MVYCLFDLLSNLQSALNPLSTGNPSMSFMANTEYPDEIPHKVVFHHGLHCLLRQNRYSENEM